MNVNNTISNIKPCYKNRVFAHKICRSGKSAYLCNVFFIVLNLRLTKVGVRRDSFFCSYPTTARRGFWFLLPNLQPIYTPYIPILYTHGPLVFPLLSGVAFLLILRSITHTKKHIKINLFLLQIFFCQSLSKDQTSHSVAGCLLLV